MHRPVSWLLAFIYSTALLCLPAPAQNEEFDFGSSGFDFGSIGGLDNGGFGVDQDDPVSISAQFTAATDDRPAVLMVTATIDPGWHIYSITQPNGGPLRTKITLDESGNYMPVGNWSSYPNPEAHIDRDIFKGVRIEEHSERVTWYVPIKLGEGVDIGTLSIKGQISIQACKTGCQNLDIDFSAKVGEGVEIGPIDLASPTNVATGSNTASPTTPVPTPPENAGVFRAASSEVAWYGWLDKTSVAPGGRVRLYLRAEMPEHWHLNAYATQKPAEGPLPTLIAIEPNASLQSYRPDSLSKLTQVESPAEGFGTLRYHEQLAAWAIPIDVAESTAPGSFDISGRIGYQACESDEQSTGSCELPQGIQFSAQLQVGERVPTTESGVVNFVKSSYAEAATLAAGVADSLQKAGSDYRIVEFNGNSSNVGILGMLGAALVGGLILNLMPCVLPVIGLKIMSFAKQGGESRLRVFLLNLTYVAGLLTVFLLLATLASLPQLGLTKTTSYDWGELYTETWFKVFMSVLVFVMALSFLNVWEIPIPGFAGSSTAAGMASREGYGGAFFKGILTTILATPCSGPFLGPVFGYTIGQEVQTTYLIFLFVGLGMALPYLIVGAFPSLVKWIPKPGAWMDTFKQSMAFLLLGTVVYLLSTINPEYFIPTMALLVTCWFACWLGGRLPITAPATTKWASWVSGLMLATIVGYVGFTWENEYELPWQDFSIDQLAEAQATGNPVLLEFTANWCPNCKVNLATALDVMAVKKVVDANQVQAIKADYSDKSPEIKAMINQLDSRTIPLLAVFPAGRPSEVIVLRDLVSQTQVLQALAAAGAKKSNPERNFVLHETKPEPAARRDSLASAEQ